MKCELVGIHCRISGKPHDTLLSASLISYQSLIQLHFRTIGMAIKDKFDGAAEVKVIREEREEKPRIVMKNSQFKRHTNADLVYMTPSPDFCEADPARGILGTKGRQCTLSPNAIDDCSLVSCFSELPRGKFLSWNFKFPTGPPFFFAALLRSWLREKSADSRGEVQLQVHLLLRNRV